MLIDTHSHALAARIPRCRRVGCTSSSHPLYSLQIIVSPAKIFKDWPTALFLPPWAGLLLPHSHTHVPASLPLAAPSPTYTFGMQSLKSRVFPSQASPCLALHPLLLFAVTPYHSLLLTLIPHQPSVSSTPSPHLASSFISLLLLAMPHCSSSTATQHP